MPHRKQISIEAAVEIAARQFGAKRFEDVSIAEIAKEAKCSTTTIYDVFGDKRGLYAEAMIRRMGRHFLDRAQLLKEVQCPLLRLERMARSHVTYLSFPGTRREFRNRIADLDKTDPDITQAYRQRLDAFWDIVLEDIRLAMAAGLLQQDRPEDVAEVYFAILAWRPLLMGLHFSDKEPIGRDPEEIVRLSLKLYLTPAGEAALDALPHDDQEQGRRHG
jgi:AcrR family transcriptional regulator